MQPDAQSVKQLAEEVASASWYHTIDLPGGVTTPGRFDTRRSPVELPSLEGKRCLDVGTWDGYWAFEMERRGASEVIAVDLRDASRWDWPLAADPELKEAWCNGVDDYVGFGIAHRALESRVKRLELSVYELSPDAIGTFDFVFVGSILPHLRDPYGALAAIRSVSHGELISADQISLSLTLLHPRTPVADLTARNEPFWWNSNLACRKRLLRAARFEILRASSLYRLAPGPGAPKPAGHLLRENVVRRIGIPHVWFLCSARPAAERR